MKSIALTAILLLAAPRVWAQSPYLVKDLNTTTVQSPASSNPVNFFSFGPNVYFAAASAGFGVELWSTDGTAAGTHQVANIASGSSFPNRFINVNGHLIFNATGAEGEELWTSDGTTAGTKLFADIYSGFRSSSPGDRIVYHDKMFFSADDGVDGRELWITDGTPAGTRLFKDLYPGAIGSSPGHFVIFNDTLYFSAGAGLWKSDGTEAGTVLVTQSVSPNDIVSAGSFLFIAATDGIWVSDGTASGTHVLDGTAGVTTLLGQNVRFGNRILFPGRDSAHGTEPWISDGTAAGTHMVVDLDPRPQVGGVFTPYFTVIGNVAYFAAETPANGFELWKTDGTAAGTSLVSDIVPGTAGSSPSQIIAVGQQLYFVASDGTSTTATSLWTSDGTAAGTHRVGNAGPILSATPALVAVGSTIYFSASMPLTGFELWKSDGTDAGTVMVANIAADLAPASTPANFTAAGDWVYFDAWDGIATAPSTGTPIRSLFRSDGTSAGTVKLADSPLTPYFTIGHSVLFSVPGSLTGTQWISDGTPEGTKPATELVGRFSPAVPVIFVSAIGDTVLAYAGGGLWATRLPAGSPVVQIGPGGYRFAPFGNRVMFFVSTQFVAPATTALWITDGNAANTHMVYDLGTAQVGENVVFGGYFYFIAGTQLWKSDGTYEGTAAVATLPNAAAGFVVAGKNLFFTVVGQLWVSDGTGPGTHQLAIKNPGSLAAVGDKVVFNYSDPDHGSELWVSDGTDAGTHLLSDIYPGTNSGAPSQITAAAGLAYFEASDGFTVHGLELWSTDGTEGGTKMVADIEPGSTGSFPMNFGVAGSRLYFSASQSATGQEPWALPLPQQFSIGDTFAREGTNAVFTVTLTSAAGQAAHVDYATADGTAIAGKDYLAASGTLTFAADESSKTVIVPLYDNSTPENNRNFFLKLSNASGAVIVRPAGSAMIEDDDQIADLGLSLDFSNLSTAQVNVVATNNGPRAATDMRMKVTQVGGPLPASCDPCSIATSLLASGAAATEYTLRGAGQEYFTAAISAHQRDPQLSNNSVGFSTNSTIAMDALYLTPGAQANVWYNKQQSAVTISSSNPAIVSVPASLAAGATPTFVAQGVGVGSATITISGPSFPIGTLKIDVVAAGTHLRYLDSVDVNLDTSFVSFDQAASLRVQSIGRAPFTGDTATGLLTISENGQELARGTLVSGTLITRIPFYLPSLGGQTLTFNYAGDANFLPISGSLIIQVASGEVTILPTVDQSGSNVTLHLHVNGSPQSPPTGTVTVTEAGGVGPFQAVLSGGEAVLTLPALPGGRHTFSVAYSGDVHYHAATQTAVVTIGGRHRAAGH